MSSWGRICICGAGCKHESGCRGFGSHHKVEITTSAMIISGTAPVNNNSTLAKKSSYGAEEGPGCKYASCNDDPFSC